ncbi:hypothetical protein H9Q13_05995 [Pontibacter sp. JH31]|uniref:Uncharacterized protein n=1 Tax=Pontibacter aquaedesilientis TaxID=2766980 RepID=A0ABR7XEI9_9BACT|nr:hypothetical protein [Pontibacter aquaedesilientis]MBD1396712.1 hypothetical protein [Pontibacter aquaedesilientis]
MNNIISMFPGLVSFWPTRVKKTILLAVTLLAGGFLYAQPSGREKARSESIREEMLKAHGGERSLSRLGTLEYSVLETDYTNVPPATTRTNYYLDIKNRQLTATTSSEGISIVKTLSGSGAWQVIDGVRTPLPEDEKEQLERNYFLNFLMLLQNGNSMFEFKRNCQYKNSTANELLVSNPFNPTQKARLFLSEQTGRVLALAWHEAHEPNPMLQYTDFKEYNPIGKGLILPMEYQVYTNGEVSAEGRIVDVKVRGK